MSRARRRDRWVYLAGHPVLFTLLSATRRRPLRELGRTLLVHGESEYREALIRVPLDRQAQGTTGAMARSAGADAVLFDQEGVEHRSARHNLADRLCASGVAALRPLWTEMLDDAVTTLSTAGRIDMVELAAAIAGRTTQSLLDLAVDPVALARAAQDAAAEVARAHLPGTPSRPGPGHAEALLALTGDGLGAMLAVAAVNTTVAALPRAVAWCADAHLWTDVSTTLADELLRVVAPTPLLPRVAAEDATIGDRAVRAGDRLVLVVRHAVGAHRRDPDPVDPAPARVANLVFGAGPHACPGARLARVQLLDTLTALAPLRPVVVSARPDRRSALPSWRRLVIAAR